MDMYLHVEKELIVARCCKKGELYNGVHVAEVLLGFTKVPDFVNISSLTTASVDVTLEKCIVLDMKISGREKLI